MQEVNDRYGLRAIPDVEPWNFVWQYILARQAPKCIFSFDRIPAERQLKSFVGLALLMKQFQNE
jgi:hypothetical protein